MRIAQSAVSSMFILTLTLVPSLASAGSPPCAQRSNNTMARLLECVTLDGVREHQAALQAIADANGGTRALGTPGYASSVDYVVARLVAAGYDVTVQQFSVGAHSTSNVLAESRHGNRGKVVLVGAHLDSVPGGPGIQDNGSGAAAILEVAEQLAKAPTANKIRFAWWGAEESNRAGSMHYLSALSAEEKNKIMVYLNFDMVGSPNFVRFVYAGDGVPCATQSFFEGFYASRGLPFERISALAVSSSHVPFLNTGIPAGGLFTGAEGIKTPEQAAIFGGTAGQQYDPCYHLACDTFNNISLEVLEQNSQAIAAAILHHAMMR